MARSKEVGRIQFTCTLPLKPGLKVYEFAEKLDVGANKVLQMLIEHAVEHAEVKRVNRNTLALVFNDEAECEESSDEDVGICEENVPAKAVKKHPEKAVKKPVARRKNALEPTERPA